METDRKPLLNGGHVQISKHMADEFEHVRAVGRRREQHEKKFPTNPEKAKKEKR